LAILPGYKRIRTEDFDKTLQGLISKLAFPINSAFDSLFGALNNALTFKDNFLATQLSFTVTVDVNGNPTTNPTLPLSSAQAAQKVSGLFVINATNTNNILPIGGIFVNFTSATGNKITINNVKGLPANTPFTITMIVLS
jgi:hypothetical protein